MADEPLGTRVRQYIDYLFPREVVGAVTMVFALENVVNAAVGEFVPENYRIYVWIGIFLLFSVVFQQWGTIEGGEADPEEDPITSLSEVINGDEDGED